MEQNKALAGVSVHIKRFGVAALIGVAAELAILFLFALAAAKWGNAALLQSVGVYVAAVIGGLLSGFPAARAFGKNGLANGGIAALLCSGLTTAVAWLFSAETSANPIVGLACVAGGLVGGLIGVNLTKR